MFYYKQRLEELQGGIEEEKGRLDLEKRLILTKLCSVLILWCAQIQELQLGRIRNESESCRVSHRDPVWKGGVTHRIVGNF